MFSHSRRRFVCKLYNVPLCHWPSIKTSFWLILGHFFGFFYQCLNFLEQNYQKKWQKLYFCQFLKYFIPDVRISKLNWMSDFCENEHMEFHSIQQSMFPILCDPILIKSSSAAPNSRNSIFAMTRKLYCWSIPDTPFPAKIYLLLKKSRILEVEEMGNNLRFL